MKSKIVRIGNSRGVFIPKLLLEQAGLDDEVELRVVKSGLIIAKLGTPRAGWAEAAVQLRARGEGELLDEPMPTDLDESEWAR